jgi:methionine sulfoxide reductase heme-binding subunit
VTWYLARATGLVLLVVFTASTALGVISSTASTTGPDRRVPRFVATDLHRRLSLLALLLLAGHIAVSVADSYVSIGPLDAVVPFMGSYRRAWLGLGTVATDLTIAVAVTSGLRQRMSPRAWRAVHLGAYLAWPAVLLHGLGTGSDTTRLPVLVLSAACAAVVLVALGWRLVAGRPHPVGVPRLAALTALPLLAVALAVWTVGGPMAPGWAKRSGTPAAPSRTVPAAERVGAR